MPLVPYQCGECGKAADKRGRAKGLCHRCYHRVARKRWDAEHRAQTRAKTAAWHQAHRVERNDRTTARRRAVRAKVVRELGGKCQCCGETTPVFLTIDHVQNDGAKDRQTARHLLYKRILTEGCPPDRYQILCWNCNSAKALGGCPHQRPKTS